MSFNNHPSVALRLEYRGGSCSAGAALAVATHVALCPQCARTQRGGAWGGRDLPGVLAADHGRERRAYTDALGAMVAEDWRVAESGSRTAALRGAGSIGEAVLLIEAAPGAPMTVPGGAMFIVVLQGRMTDGAASYTRGAFIDLAVLHLLEPMGGEPHGCICLLVSETG